MFFCFSFVSGLIVTKLLESHFGKCDCWTCCLFCFVSSLFVCVAVSDVYAVLYCLCFVFVLVLVGVTCPKVMFCDWYNVCAYVVAWPDVWVFVFSLTCCWSCLWCCGGLLVLLEAFHSCFVLVLALVLETFFFSFRIMWVVFFCVYFLFLLMYFTCICVWWLVSLANEVISWIYTIFMTYGRIEYTYYIAIYL